MSNAFQQCISGVFAILLIAAGFNYAAADEPRVHIETVLIRGGTFTMGTPIRNPFDSEYHRDERRLTVGVANFRIGKHPVTAEQMCVFLNSPEAEVHDKLTLYNHKDLGDSGLGYYRYSTIALGGDGQYTPRKSAEKAPANQVTWKGAVQFCVWLSQKTGKKYRLPTEAEWELAARGVEGRRWPWGERLPTKSHGPRYDSQHSLNTAEYAARRIRNEPTWTTTAVGSHPSNATPEGVHDMLAYTIGEWCTNKYVERPNPEQMINPQVDLDDLTTPRVVRGYYHRHNSGVLSFMGAMPHLGRPWTRIGCHPIDAVQQAARHGFRVVEELESTTTLQPGVSEPGRRFRFGLTVLCVIVAIIAFSGLYRWRARHARTD